MKPPISPGRFTAWRSRRSAYFTTAIGAPPETRGTQAAAMVRRCRTSCRLSPPVGLLDAAIPSPPRRHAGSTYTLTPFSGPARPRMRFVTGTGSDAEANMPDEVEYKGWLIEPQSHKSERDRWRPRAL